MKWFLAVVVFVVAVLLIVIANIPANVVPMALDEIESRDLLRKGSPRLSLAETSGTLWKGQSGQAVLQLEGGTVELGELHWQLNPWTLLRGKPVLFVKAQAPGQRLKGTVTLTREGLATVDDIEGRMPISVLEPWLPMLVKGEMAFVIDHIVFDNQQLHAIDGVLNLEYVDWLGGDYAMPLGSYMAQISLQQNNVQVQLNDFGANLGMNGLISISPSGAYGFKAILQPRPELAPEVIETLAWMGKRQANGDVLIDSRGQL